MKKWFYTLVVLISMSSAMAQVKMAHVNSQKLLDTLPSRKEAMKKLQEFEASGVKELQEMERRIRKV